MAASPGQREVPEPGDGALFRRGAFLSDAPLGPGEELIRKLALSARCLPYALRSLLIPSAETTLCAEVNTDETSEGHPPKSSSLLSPSAECFTPRCIDAQGGNRGSILL